MHFNFDSLINIVYSNKYLLILRPCKLNKLVHEAAYQTENKPTGKQAYWKKLLPILTFYLIFFPDRPHLSDSCLYIYYRSTNKYHCIPNFYYLHILTDPKSGAPIYYICMVWPLTLYIHVYTQTHSRGKLLDKKVCRDLLILWYLHTFE